MKASRRHVEIVYVRNKKPKPVPLDIDSFGATVEERVLHKARGEREARASERDAKAR